MTTVSTPTGRPRDPQVDRRITRAAVALFGETGWAGFSVEAVARRAGVGKASIYLRWPTKEQLLTHALATRVANVADADTGTLRGDLVHLARQLLELHVGDGYQAVFTLENGFGANNGAMADTTRLFDRQAWVGIASPAGTFRLGRQNTAIFFIGDAIDYTTRTTFGLAFLALVWV